MDPAEDPESSGRGEGAPAAPPPPPDFRQAAAPQPALQPTLDEAAAAGRKPEADLALHEREAAAHPDAARRAVLLCEVARLREQAGDGKGALAAARSAFAADPSLLAGLWLLRRLLAAAGQWQELAAAYETAVASAPVALPPADRADLLVERGRLLEDRLGRDADAAASYRAGLAADADHEAALLSLYLLGARAGDRDAVETALAGLARRAASPGSRAALGAALARVQREGDAGGRAAQTVADELAAAGDLPEASVLPLLRELEALSRGGDPEVRLAALGELGRRLAPLDAALAAALLREQARLEPDPEAVLRTLEEAARLAPAHPLVAAALIDVGERLDRPDVMARAVTAFAAAAPADADRLIDLTLRQVEALGRAGRHAEALASLDVRLGARPEALAWRVTLLARGRDVPAVAAAFESEGSALVGTAAAWPLTLAGAIHQFVLDDAAAAEALYGRALEVAPGYRAALDALEALLVASGRTEERAALLEEAISARAGTAPAADPGREAAVREELVALWRDELARPDRALPHQRRLAELAPDDVRQRVRLWDLELAVGAGQADTALALAEAAGHPAVAAALKLEAIRGLAPAAAGDEAAREKVERLLREAVPDDVTGLGVGELERTLAEPAARAAAVAEELQAMVGQAPGDVVRALRFRLAHHQAAAGQLAEAIATLTPLRSEGDALARSWSWDLARQSGDAILEVAVLSEEAASTTPTVAARGDVLVALGEALERAGDPGAAADAFRRAFDLGRDGERPADAALGLLRLAAAAPAQSPNAMLEALQAVAEASPGDARLAAAARREAALLRVAMGRPDPDDLVLQAPPGATPADRAEASVVRWGAAARRGDTAAVAAALADMADGLVAPSGAAVDDAVPLLARAAARARLAGPEIAEAMHRRAWQASRAATLATALADLPVTPGAGWPADRPDPRRSRAARTPGALGLALDLEAALDAERRGALGAALGGYARVIAAAPEQLEAWEGMRRVARVGGDPVGEARALARLGALVKKPARAAALSAEAARLYEQAGHWDEAMALWGKALEARPDEALAFQRLRELLLGAVEQGSPDAAAALDRLMSHRLQALDLAGPARGELLLERAHHRLSRLGDSEGAVQDFKRILNIDPQHDEALWQLGALAVALGDRRSAVPYLERFLSVTRDDGRASAAELELAACYEATQERPRAIELLRRAASLRPQDPAPMEQLAELYLRQGEWRSAIETMRAFEGRLQDERARAALHLRIGGLLRDLGRDATGAALSFRRAAELDPLGEGMRALVALHEGLGDAAGGRQTIEREIAQLRQALEADPLDGERLARLAEFLGALRARAPDDGGISEALQVVGEVRALLEPAGPPARPPSPPRPLAPSGGGAFWAQLAHPGALGFLAELWPQLVDAAAALFPAPAERVPAREARIVAGAESRLGWIEATAAASGISGLRLYLAGASAPAGQVTPVLEPEPALVVGAAALKGAPEVRFRVGHALALLRDRTVALEWMTGDDLAALFVCAASVAGVTLGAPPPEAMLRTVSRVMSRRDRKALVLQASRFGFEALDPTRWRHAVLRTADRLGLLLAGDLAASAAAAAELGAGSATPEALRASTRACDLLRFALGESYPALKRQAGLGG